jgi:hypothetical protein
MYFKHNTMFKMEQNKILNFTIHFDVNLCNKIFLNPNFRLRKNN